MSNYAKANKTIQWYQDDYPGAVLDLSAETMVLTVHTTEGMTWPGYGGGQTAPNYTGFPPLEGVSSGKWRAHFPDERSSRALRNLDGGVQTNTLNTVQVELIGTCDPAHAKTWGSKRAGIDYVYWPNASDEQLAWLADLVADLHRRHGLRLTAPTFQAYPASYGARSGTNDVRFSFDQWRNFAGICGHQHVPENVHGDPGNIKMAKVITFAEEMLSPPPEPVTSHPRWAIRTTGVYETPGGTKLRDIPAGYEFQVIDGSGAGMNGWVQTTHGNWVLGADTTIYDPAIPVQFSVMDWNVENKGDADAALDRAEIIKLVAEHKPHFFALQEVYRVDLADIPGYQTYHPFEGYPVDSENRAQAILVRNDVALKIKQALPMEEEWIGPKLGIRHDPRVHRYVTGNIHDTNIPVATFHVPFGAAAVEETRLAAIAWAQKMEAAHGVAVIAADWNSLADDLQAKVGTPAGAAVDGGGKDRFVFLGCKKVGSKNLGNRGRSDHPVKKLVFEA